MSHVLLLDDGEDSQDVWLMADGSDDANLKSKRRSEIIANQNHRTEQVDRWGFVFLL
jgi:hypothetical protein